MSFKRAYLSVALTLLVLCDYASDSLIIKINKFQFLNQDTLSFSCSVPVGIHDSKQIITLNVYIENIDNRNQRWRYRYPVINGEVSADLIIGNTIPEGKYAVNFAVQNQFLSLEGKVKDYKQKQNSLLSYMVLGKYETHYFDILMPEHDGNFRLKSLLFVDTAYFVFTPGKKKSADYLWIDLKNSLDSAYTPLITDTRLITIGSPDKTSFPGRPYQFDLKKILKETTTLPDVIVTSKKKKMVERYNEEYSTGLFARTPLEIYDGLESDQISHSYNIYEFLKGQIPGLNVNYNEGQYSLNWRGAGVEVYLDEFAFPINSDDYVNPSDIAMIKVYSPPANMGNNPRSGAIAIYTKKGAYNLNPNKKNKFKITGYTPDLYIWQ